MDMTKKDSWQLENKELLQKFLSTLSSQNTRKMFTSDLTQLSNFLEKPFVSVDEMDAKRFFDFMLEQIRLKKLRSNTVIKKFFEIHSLYQYLMEQELVSMDLFEKYLYLLKKRYPTNSITIPDLSSIDLLLSAAEENLMHYFIVSLVLRLGLIPSEICNLKLTDLVISDDICQIVVGSVKKARILELPQDLVAIQSLYLEQRTTTSNYLFVNKRNNPLNERYLERMITKLCQLANIPHLTFMDLRKLSAASQLTYEVSPKDVAYNLGIQQQSAELYNNLMTRSFFRNTERYAKIYVKTPSKFTEE